MKIDSWLAINVAGFSIDAWKKDPERANMTRATMSWALTSCAFHSLCTTTEGGRCYCSPLSRWRTLGGESAPPSSENDQLRHLVAQAKGLGVVLASSFSTPFICHKPCRLPLLSLQPKGSLWVDSLALPPLSHLSASVGKRPKSLHWPLHLPLAGNFLPQRVRARSFPSSTSINTSFPDNPLRNTSLLPSLPQ